MYVSIHAVDEYKDSKGKKTEAWGAPEFNNIWFDEWKRGVEIVFSCTEESGTGERSIFAEMKSIRRTASVCLTQEDVAELLAWLVGSNGLDVDERMSLKLIEKLAKDLIERNERQQ